MSKNSLRFEVVDLNENNAQYSDGCSGNRSDCCTRVCTRVNITSSDDSLDAWDKYLEVNAGILQY